MQEYKMNEKIEEFVGRRHVTQDAEMSLLTKAQLIDSYLTCQMK
jgi:hypothetical protein